MADIKERIRAMLRKAGEGNPSEEEREVALRMAHKLMMKHGFSEEDIGDPDRDPGKFQEEPYIKTTGEHDAWKGTLLCNIAEFWFVDAFAYQARFTENRFAAEWFLHGRRDRIDVFKMMFEFIVPQLEAAYTEALNNFGNIQERHARQYALETCKEMSMSPELVESMTEADLATFGLQRLQMMEVQGGDAVVRDIMDLCDIDSFNYAKKVRAYVRRCEIGRGRADSRADVWRHSFFIGAIAELRERLRVLMREEEEDLEDNAQALVLSEREALVQWQKEIGHETETRADNRAIDRQGVRAGVEAGANADLMPGKKLNIERKELNA